MSAPTDGSSPSALLALVSSYLKEQGLDSTSKSLGKELKKKNIDIESVESSVAIPSLPALLSAWNEKSTKTRKSRSSSSASSSSSSSDSDSESSDHEDSKSSSSSSSSSSESSGSESESHSKKKIKTKSSKVHKKSASSSSSSSSSTSSSSSSDSDADDEQEKPKTKVVKKVVTEVPVPATNPLKRKAPASSSGSSSESSSESDSSSDERPTKKTKKNKAESSSESSSSSSSSESESEKDTAQPTVKQNKKASSDTSASTGSSSDSEPSKSTLLVNGVSAKTIVKLKQTASKGRSGSSSSGTVIGDDKSPSEEAATEHGMHPARQQLLNGTKKHEGARPTKLAQLSAQAADDEHLSNKYVSYDYADRAYNDLSVTRGKGFTKEKNKKKRGSYRGGTIDIGGGKGFKFED